MRIIKSGEVWWVVGNGTIARVPPELADISLETLPANVLATLNDSSLAHLPESHAYHITVLTSTRCNLTCAYCFQHETIGTPSSPPVRIKPASINSAIIDEIFEFVGRQMEQYRKQQIDLMLFGGEPLLTPAACLEILTRASAIGLASASMITNGVLLAAPLTADLSAAGLGSIQITLDGDRISHDEIRHTRGGRGTYETILKNIRGAQESSSIRIIIRVNLTTTSIQRVDSLIDDLAARLAPDNINVAFAMVHDPGIGFSNVAERNSDLIERIVDGYGKLASLGFHIPLPQDGAQCIACGEIGGTTGAVINADGKLYSCWESAGKPNWEVGDIYRGFHSGRSLADRWVACGYSASADDVAAASGTSTTFQDNLDAKLLDFLYHEQLLHRTVSQEWVST